MEAPPDVYTIAAQTDVDVDPPDPDLDVPMEDVRRADDNALSMHSAQSPANVGVQLIDRADEDPNDGGSQG